MPVNLNNLNIGLDQFNAAASGKHNIGQLKLGGDGASVVRTNNHKHWTIFNNTEIRPEESLAIKDAFCNALSREGLSEDKVEEIREKLGIGGGRLESLKAGDIKPLSAAEVREIIDQNAEELNLLRAPDAQLRTSADIYRGVSQKTLEKRKTARDQINADTLATMETRAGGVVGQMVDLLQAKGKRSDFSAFTKNIAREIRSELNSTKTLVSPGQTLDLKHSPITLKHERNGHISAQFTLDNGHTFSVDTNLTRGALYAQMNMVLSGEEEIREEPEESGRVQPNAGPKPREARYKGLIAELRKVFDTAKNPEEMEYRKLHVLPHLSKGGKNGKPKFSDEDLDIHARAQVRDDLTDPIVERLVNALRDVRGMDHRNAELVNQVRAVIYGDKTIDADELVNEIDRVLNREPVKADPILQQIEDDFDAPLNINQLLGNN
jgi:hypothetical protein